MARRFEVYLVNLDDDVTDDPKNTRPGVVISPDEMNRNLSHVIIAPISSTKAKYPTRLATEFLNAERWIILDQLRTVENNRLVQKIGEVDESTANSLIDLLHEIFAK